MAKRLPKAKPDCQTCGLCCLAGYEQDAFCDVTEADLKKLVATLGERWIKRNVLFASPFDMLCQAIDGRNGVDAAIKTKTLKVRSGALKGCEVCACTALRGVPLKKVSCAIYENRPHACRVAVKPGDRVCKAIRNQATAFTS